MTGLKSFGMDFSKRLLFPKINNDGTANMKTRWKSKDLTATLKRDLKSFQMYEGETPHSFRHGGTVKSLKQGRSLEKTMYLAYMKNVKTVQSYSRGLKVQFPSFDWKEAGVKYTDELDLMCQMKS